MCNIEYSNESHSIQLKYFDAADIREKLAIMPNEVQIWLFDIRKYQKPDTDNLIRILSDEEKAKSRRYSCLVDYKRFTIGHALLRILISRYLQCAPDSILFFDNKYGKKYIIQSPLHFNISHSGDKIAIAFTLNMDVGIDIEYIDCFIDYLDIAKHYFLKNESNIIFSQTSEDKRVEYFYKTWTVKEAYVKSLGCGLKKPLKSFEVLEDGWIKEIIDNRRYPYYSKRLKGNYIFSVVVV